MTDDVKWLNWQIYHNKPGQANKNSNIESFNNVIKENYTNRRKLSMKAALMAIGKLILSYSTEPVEFEVYPKYNSKIKEVADKLSKANFNKFGPHKYGYESSLTNTCYRIILNCPQCHNMCSCTCKNFVKNGVCCHVVALDRIFNLKLFHPKYSLPPLVEKFVTKCKSGRRTAKDYGKALDKPKEAAKVDKPSAPKASTPKVINKVKRKKSTKESFAKKAKIAPPIFDFEAKVRRVSARNK